jgi:hypothetical protein
VARTRHEFAAPRGLKRGGVLLPIRFSPDLAFASRPFGTLILPPAASVQALRPSAASLHRPRWTIAKLVSRRAIVDLFARARQSREAIFLANREGWKRIDARRRRSYTKDRGILAVRVLGTLVGAEGNSQSGWHATVDEDRHCSLAEAL